VGKRHIDVRNVIWLGTSNLGNELVLECQAVSEEPMSRDGYMELVGRLRPRISECLGVSARVLVSDAGAGVDNLAPRRR
jgi:hypothetical protein